MENLKLDDLLQNNEVCYWLLDDKIKLGLNLNSNLSDLAKFLFIRFDIERVAYAPIKFSLNDEIYENLELRLADIWIQNNYFILIELTTFPTFPMECTLRDRDLNLEYKDGILFKLFFLDKLKFLIEKCLADTSKIGTYFREIIEYILAGTDHPIEISTIQEKREEIDDLTKSYLSGIRRILKKLFLL